MRSCVASTSSGDRSVRAAWILSVILGVFSVKQWFYGTLIDPWLGDASGSLVYSLCFVLLVWGLGVVLYRRKIYVKI